MSLCLYCNAWTKLHFSISGCRTIADNNHFKPDVIADFSCFNGFLRRNTLFQCLPDHTFTEMGSLRHIFSGNETRKPDFLPDCFVSVAFLHQFLYLQ